MSKIVTQYNGKCSACGAAFRSGDNIYLEGKNGEGKSITFCESCGPNATAGGAPAPTGSAQPPAAATASPASSREALRLAAIKVSSDVWATRVNAVQPEEQPGTDTIFQIADEIVKWVKRDDREPTGSDFAE